MHIIGWGILLLLSLIMPFGLGMIPVKYMDERRKTPAMLYACGWFVSFAIFEVVSIPFILLEKSFSGVVVIYTAVLVVVLGFSVWKGHGVLTECIKKYSSVRELPVMVKVGWMVAILCIGGQVLASIFFEYYDGDDSYYMAQAMIADTYDVMFKRDAYTGYEFGLDIRHALSPVPIYIAWLSRMTGIHAVIIAHSVLAPIWIVFMYCIYVLLAEKLFERNREYRPLFVIMISIWLCFGNVSIHTAETFSMTRIWQGKGLMAGIVIPTLFLCLLYFGEQVVSRGVWSLFVLCILTSGFATTTSIMIVPTMVGLAALFLAYRKKDILWLGKLMGCCIPCVILGFIYLVVK